ncbi:MAG TPA: hypothetical protein VK772_17765 [Puia sp.]|nr:hypothetical protein [Puia sp.]
MIKKKLLGHSFKEPHPKGLNYRINQVYGIQSSLFRFLNDEINLRELLIGLPNTLDKLKSRFTNKKDIKSIKSLVRYDSFSEKDKDKNGAFRFYNCFHLAENLGQSTCIYCNRLYTTTVITAAREFIARPTFDHWFPKSRYPLLALSFYNLIPSCSVCNMTIKGSDVYSINDVFHPYFKHSDPTQQLNFRFSYDLEDHKVAKPKLIYGNAFSQRSITTMQLEEMYKVHKEEIRELIYLKKAYSSAYLESLEKILKTKLSDSEVYRLAFGVYSEEEQHFRRPLSKMKKDILTELGILK